LWFSSLQVMNFLSWVPYCLCSEHSFFLWARLKIVDGKFWLSVEYQSCCLVRAHACEYFSFYHIYCGFKDIKIASSTAAVSPKSRRVDSWLSSGWSGRRIILLVDCFMCMVVLVLRITYGKVVLIQTVLNFVAWQLEKASKYSVAVYTVSLVIWITSI
jgi:hypothetical protein